MHLPCTEAKNTENQEHETGNSLHTLLKAAALGNITQDLDGPLIQFSKTAFTYDAVPEPDSTFDPDHLKI